MQYSESFNAPGGLNPLDPVLRFGLCWIVSLGWLSLLTSGGLFCLLTWRLIRWAATGQLQEGANQFFVLVYNLLLADLQQAVAYTVPTVYLIGNRIEVPSVACFVNGWFVSVGDLSSGVFIFGIAVHTFLSIVKGKCISNRIFYGSILLGWTFIYIMAIVTANMPNVYTRAGAWCWVNALYADQRLYLHYLWIFICMFSTVLLYAITFATIWIRSRSEMPPAPYARHETSRTKQAAKCMVIYPAAYVLCALPLCACRMAQMQGHIIPYSLYCFAGAAITSCGWLDVLLYTTTRRVLILAEKAPAPDDFGLDTYDCGWIGGNFWGTQTTIQGPLTRQSDFPSHEHVLLNSPRLSRRGLTSPSGDEEYFAAPVDGAIAMKTTVEVSSGPLPGYEGSETCMIERRSIHDLTNHGMA